MKKLSLTSPKYLTTFLIILILILGAYLRLYKISEYMTFLGDEGRDVLVVKRMIVDHSWTLLGPTASVGGFFLGPIYYYLMIPFLWAWRLDPTGPAVMVALFGIATIWLVYRLGTNLKDEAAGLSAASLYALSPLVISFSRSSWNPNLVPFFSVLAILCLWYITERNRTSYVFWLGVIMGIGLQLHYLFLFLGVVAVIWLAIFEKREDLIKTVLLGSAGFVVGYFPFLLFELRHGFPNTKTLFQFLLAGKETGFHPKAFIDVLRDIPFRSFGRLVLRFPQPERWQIFAPWQISLWIGLVRTLLFSSIGLLILIVFSPLASRIIRIPDSAFKVVMKRRNAWLLLIWFTIVIIMFGFYKRAIYDYYFGILFPLPFLLTGVVISLLYSYKYTRLLYFILLGSILIFNWMGRPFIFPPNNQLKQMRTIAKEALTLTGGKPFNFALITGFNSDHAYRYFFEVWGNSPVTIENESVDAKRRTVTNQLIVICELSECHPLGHPLWEIAGFGRAQIDAEREVSFVKIIKLRHYP